MKILIVAATPGEVSSLLKTENQSSESGLFSGEKYDVLITGVGIYATVFHLTRCLCANNYDLIINAGICGTFDHDRQLAEVVNVITDYFGDFGVEHSEGFYTASEMGFYDRNEFPYVDGRLFTSDFSDSGLINALPEVSGVTVQKAHGEQKSIKAFRKKNLAEVESMEGAAVFYVAIMMKVKCIQIRAISNYVEPRNRAAWKVEEAIENLNFQLQKIIMELSD